MLLDRKDKAMSVLYIRVWKSRHSINAMHSMSFERLLSKSNR